MNILVDHGSSHNLGDTSMLEGGLRQALKRLPEAQFYVIDRPRLQTEAFDWPRVHRQPIYSLQKPLALSEASPVRRWVQRKVVGAGRRLVQTDVERDALPLNLPEWLTSPEDLSLSESQEPLRAYCEPFDGLLLIGGGYLTDSFAWSTVQRIALIRAFEQQGKPVVLTGQQIGPFHSSISARAVAEALRLADFVGVREPTGSLAFCRDASVPNYHLMGDDSFGLSADTEEAETLLQRYGLQSGAFIALNVRVARYAAEHERHIEEVINHTRALMDATGMPALVVPISLNPKSSDVTSGYQLQKGVGEDLVVLDEPNLTPAAVKGVLGKAYGVFGVSYHFCTFALSAGVPAVCIYDGAYYGQKAVGLCGFWGDDRLALALPSPNAVPHVLEVWHDKALRLQLEARATEASAEWYRIVEKEVGRAFGGEESRGPESLFTA